MILKTLATLGAVTALTAQLSLCGQTVTPPTAAQVIADAQTLCSYTPLATDVETVLNANQTVQNAQAIAQLVCNAIEAATVKPSATGAAAPVNAVSIVVNGKSYVVHVQPK